MKDKKIDYIVENIDVRQRPDEGFRQWFLNQNFDIILWYESEHGKLIGFQFCYGKPDDERAFTYSPPAASHHYVMNHSTDFREHQLATAVLKGDAGVIADDVCEKFKKESKHMETKVTVFILEKIRAYNKRFRSV